MGCGLSLLISELMQSASNAKEVGLNPQPVID